MDNQNNQNNQETPKGFFEFCPNFDRTIFVKFDADGVLSSLNYCCGQYGEWEFTRDNPQLRGFVLAYLVAHDIDRYQDTDHERFTDLVNLALDGYIPFAENFTPKAEKVDSDLDYKKVVKWARDLPMPEMLTFIGQVAQDETPNFEEL